MHNRPKRMAHSVALLRRQDTNCYAALFDSTLSTTSLQEISQILDTTSEQLYWQRSHRNRIYQPVAIPEQIRKKRFVQVM